MSWKELEMHSPYLLGRWVEILEFHLKEYLQFSSLHGFLGTFTGFQLEGAFGAFIEEFNYNHSWIYIMHNGLFPLLDLVMNLLW